MMFAPRLAACLLAGLPAMPAAARAGEEVGATARVTPALSYPRRVVASGRVWRCAGDTCVSRLPAAPPSGWRRDCLALSWRFDRILAFEAAGTPFTEAELSACNIGRPRPRG